MSNHIHLIWQALPGFTPSAVQASFMKYTAQQFKRSMLQTIPDKLADFKVNNYDREYQIWKREPFGGVRMLIDLKQEHPRGKKISPEEMPDIVRQRCRAFRGRLFYFLSKPEASRTRCFLLFKEARSLRV